MKEVNDIINILVASDSFKGSLSSMDVAISMESGFIKSGLPVSVKKIPIADGGEGTVEAVIQAKGGKLEGVDVVDVFGKKTTAQIGILCNDTAIIETASPLGLNRISKDELDPLNASSYGLGLLIKYALDIGIKKLYIGLGGSATNDGGAGLAMALGAELLDSDNAPISYGAKGLEHLSYISIDKLDKRLKETEIILLSDVKNTLCGKNGATYIYGPQKGIEKEQLKTIDTWMYNYGKLLGEVCRKDILEMEGAGAAGGLGGALLAFADSKMERGIDSILEMINIEKWLKEVDIVFTGEGRMDGQSIYGKAPIGVASLAKKYELPVIAIVGSTGDGVDQVYNHGINLVLDIVNQPMTLDYAMKNAKTLIEKIATQAILHYNLWKKI